mmetsp:Transcript_89630/g.187216  ORF Transcript_89630/g.187216 Transcript_89630/m.187216 type:complete len:106 (+) Transcript_89630:2304-2621(+)
MALSMALFASSLSLTHPWPCGCNASSLLQGCHLLEHPHALSGSGCVSAFQLKLPSYDTLLPVFIRILCSRLVLNTLTLLAHAVHGTAVITAWLESRCSASSSPVD